MTATPRARAPGRIMGLDYGRRRIGVAMSDVGATLATPLATLQRRTGKRPPVAQLLRLADRHKVRLVVVGLPLDPDGRENDWTAEVRAFGKRLGERGRLPVEFHDERYSSVEASARLRSIGLPKAKREDKARIDAAAAAVILQDWLDANRQPKANWLDASRPEAEHPDARQGDRSSDRR